jgi:ribosomal-protein-alanine N-acetyltransferase
MTLTLRYMRLTDISEVMTIERVTFDPAWTPRSYAYEVSESTYSHMVTLEWKTGAAGQSGWRRWWSSVMGGAGETKIAAYGGLWHISGEGHISTIASHPDMRGRGYGELVLAAMVHRSITLVSDYIILEVRVSNTLAQGLYRKYGFEVDTLKRGYYQNNNEDAYGMRLELKRNPAYIPAFQQRYAALLRQHGAMDEYSAAAPPRNTAR